jgi:hypothetical protein
MWATELNEMGLDMRKALKPEVSIPWTGNSIKEYLWRPVMKAQLGKKSTTEMNTKEIDLVFNTISRHLSGKFGVSVEFPSIESLMFGEHVR